TGQPEPPNEEGHGLVGMTERAALYGGTVHAGPQPSGGWTVQAPLNLTPLPDPQGAAS
ncbi:MAG: sensor histidine kinase, partial [Pseudonocardiaceae bacterium]